MTIILNAGGTSYWEALRSTVHVQSTLERVTADEEMSGNHELRNYTIQQSKFIWVRLQGVERALWLHQFGYCSDDRLNVLKLPVKKYLGNVWDMYVSDIATCVRLLYTLAVVSHAFISKDFTSQALLLNILRNSLQLLLLSPKISKNLLQEISEKVFYRFYQLKSWSTEKNQNIRDISVQFLTPPVKT